MSAWDNPSEMMQRARDAQKQGERDMAYQLYARASELAPQDGEAWYGRAQTTSSADEGLVSFAYAVAVAPENQSLHAALDSAMASRIESATPADVSTLVAVGQEFAEVGLTDEAHIVLQRAVDLDPISSEALLWLAGTSRDPKLALKHLSNAATVAPNDQRVQSGLAALTRELYPPQVSDHSLPAISDQRVAELIRKGDDALAHGDKVLAHKFFVEATDLAPKDENAWMRRAAATDDETEQYQCYERVVAINPANLEAREARTLRRVRQLRAEMAPNAPSKGRGKNSTSRPLTAAPPPRAQDVLLRRVILILLILFALLMLAGIYLVLYR